MKDEQSNAQSKNQAYFISSSILANVLWHVHKYGRYKHEISVFNDLYQQQTRSATNNRCFSIHNQFRHQSRKLPNQWSHL
jgi:DNA-binding transcriptional regulator PaaX